MLRRCLQSIFHIILCLKIDFPQNLISFPISFPFPEMEMEMEMKLEMEMEMKLEMEMEMEMKFKKIFFA